MISWPKLYRGSARPVPHKILIRDLRVEVQNEGYQKEKKNATKNKSGWKLEP
jgi:hypothetical protein